MAHLLHGFQQPVDDGAEHFLGLQVERRTRQAWITADQQALAEKMQAADRTINQFTNDRLGRRLPSNWANSPRYALQGNCRITLTHVARIRSKEGSVPLSGSAG